MTEGIAPARLAAYCALYSCAKQGAWAEQSLRNEIKKLNLSRRDAALAAQLCYGVLQNQLLLDFWISSLATKAPNRLDTQVLISLRLGLYQLQMLDRIPPNAAVNESVNLVRHFDKNRGAAGMTNAVLRAFQRMDAVPMPPDLSTRYSHSNQLIKLFQNELGNEIEPLLQANNKPAKMFIQVNTLKTSTASLRSQLEAHGVTVDTHPFLEDCLLVCSTGNLEHLDSFKNGLFYVQDVAARLAVISSGVQRGDYVLDACAAPGGKSFAAAIQMNGQGKILARDLHEKKLRTIATGAKRLGIDILNTAAADARIYEASLRSKFDVVISDVPCSGLGIIRKKPDIRYKQLDETENLPVIQLDILRNTARYVKPGGVLLYSTCTVLRRENEAVVDAFLSKSSGWHLERFSLPHFGETCGQITLWPHIHDTDGFFIAKLRRNNV